MDQSTEIDRLVQERDQLTEQIAVLRRRSPAEPVREYAFQNADRSTVLLSELFSGKPDLIVVHNMGRGCSYCTLWADGLNGVAPHIESRAAFVVTSPDDPATQRDFAAERGWRFRMASTHGDTFFEDMGFRSGGEYWPGVSTFHHNEDGSIVRVARDFFGPGDVYCSVWHLFALLKDGANGWQPRFTY